MIKPILRTDRDNAGGIVISSDGRTLFMESKYMERKLLELSSIKYLLSNAKSKEEYFGLKAVRNTLLEIMLIDLQN